jgi:hypothetical protein
MRKLFWLILSLAPFLCSGQGIQLFSSLAVGYGNRDVTYYDSYSEILDWGLWGVNDEQTLRLSNYDVKNDVTEFASAQIGLRTKSKFQFYYSFGISLANVDNSYRVQSDIVREAFDQQYGYWYTLNTVYGESLTATSSSMLILGDMRVGLGWAFGPMQKHAVCGDFGLYNAGVNYDYSLNSQFSFGCFVGVYFPLLPGPLQYKIYNRKEGDFAAFEFGDDGVFHQITSNSSDDLCVKAHFTWNIHSFNLRNQERIAVRNAKRAEEKNSELKVF